MILRRLMILAALAAAGAGGKLAYDALREIDRPESNEALTSGTGCSLCAAHKADLEIMRQENERRSRPEETVGSDADRSAKN